MSNKADPYCCVGSNGHIWHYCVHRGLDDILEKVKAAKFKLTEQQLKDIQDILDGNHAKVDDGNIS